MNKDYDAIVEADWKRVEHDLKGLASIFLTSSLKDKGVHIPPALNTPWVTQSGVTSDACYENYSGFVVSTLFDTSPHVNKEKIKNILKGAPDDLIDRVASALMPSDIEKTWQEGSGPFLQLKWLRSQQKQLKQMIKQYGIHFAWLQKQLDNKTLPLPLPIREELQTSANALKDSVELARAYIRLFEGQKTRWKKEGEEYAALTRNPYWNDIINAVASLVDEAKKHRDCYRISKTRYSLLAALLNLAYPSIWKDDLNTLKLLRERV